MATEINYHLLFITQSLREAVRYNDFIITGQDITKFSAQFGGIDLFQLKELNAPKLFARGADLQGAWLPGAKLQGAKLPGAKLQGADLQGAKLQGADLQGADLTGAKISLDEIFYAENVELAFGLDKAIFYYEGKRVTNLALDEHNKPYVVQEQDKISIANNDFSEVVNKTEKTISFADIADELSNKGIIPKISAPSKKAKNQRLDR